MMRRDWATDDHPAIARFDRAPADDARGARPPPSELGAATPELRPPMG